MTAAGLVGIATTGAVSLVLGSTMATAALRMARGRPWLTGRSACDHCDAPVGFLSSVPLLSYMALRGACARCAGSIHPIHPTGEIAALAIGIVGFLSQGLLATLIAFLLLAIALVDAMTQRIPDLLTASVGLGAAAWAMQQGADTLLVGLIAGALGAALLTAAKLWYRRTRGVEGLGWGDVKLVGAAGVWLGAELPLALAVGSAAGLVWARANGLSGSTRFPLGPFIAAAAIAVGFGRAIWRMI